MALLLEQRETQIRVVNTWEQLSQDDIRGPTNVTDLRYYIIFLAEIIDRLMKPLRLFTQ